MVRPEIWTAAGLAVIGVGLAVWLAIDRPPKTPEPPLEPGSPAALAALSKHNSQFLPDSVDLDPASDLGAGGLNCGPSVALSNQDGGLVRLVVHAPCRQGQAALVQYGPVRFDAIIGARGTAFALLPGLPDGGVLTAEFTDSTSVEAQVPKGPVSTFLGVAWQGDAALRVEVSEYGRRVVFGRPGVGRVMRYGQKGGHQAEVYIAPSEGGRGSIKIDVAAVGVCDKELQLEALDSIGETLSVRQVTLAGPNCPASSLVLRNLLDDLRAGGPDG